MSQPDAKRCVTAWSVPHFLFGAALYASFTWLPQWESIKYASFAFTLVLAAAWEAFELFVEGYAMKQRSWGWMFVDVSGKGESLCNMMADTLLALAAHLLLQWATDSRPKLPLGAFWRSRTLWWLP